MTLPTVARISSFAIFTETLTIEAVLPKVLQDYEAPRRCRHGAATPKATRKALWFPSRLFLLVVSPFLFLLSFRFDVDVGVRQDQRCAKVAERSFSFRCHSMMMIRLRRTTCDRNISTTTVRQDYLHPTQVVQLEETSDIEGCGVKLGKQSIARVYVKVPVTSSVKFWREDDGWHATAEGLGLTVHAPDFLSARLIWNWCSVSTLSLRKF